MESISDIKEQDQLSALLEQIREWGQVPDNCDDLNIKRNLLLSVVQHLKCTDKEGNMDLALVMIKENKWRLENFISTRHPERLFEAKNSEFQSISYQN